MERQWGENEKYYSKHPSRFDFLQLQAGTKRLKRRILIFIGASEIICLCRPNIGFSYKFCECIKCVILYQSTIVSTLT